MRMHFGQRGGGELFCVCGENKSFFIFPQTFPPAPSYTPTTTVGIPSLPHRRTNVPHSEHSDSDKMAEQQHEEEKIKWPLKFTLDAQSATGLARATTIMLPHGPVPTPIFMPVGTQGTVKGLTASQLNALHAPIILGNTYHLNLRPGTDVLDAVGGLHKLEHWDRNILTDSGGFQMVSLLKLARITEEGVWFMSPHDGKETNLTPEHSMAIQNSIGADIMMQLDDCVHVLTTGPRLGEAMERSVRWLDRCNKAHKRKSEQNLFGIIQVLSCLARLS